MKETKTRRTRERTRKTNGRQKNRQHEKIRKEKG
jgi:hypothetical protein